MPSGVKLPEGTRVVTYVSRGFELMRGFDVFMKAADIICRRMKNVVFLVVGSDRVCYGGDQQFVGGSFLKHVLRTGNYDLSRFFFTGRVPEATLARILALSDLHVYLTVPFVPSWSLLDAMSCGCVVLASDQACVREYITHGRNGLLCDFFDADGIADLAVKALRDPAEYKVLGTAARITVEEEYSLGVSLPRIKKMFEEVAAGGRRQSMLARALVRPGTLKPRLKDEGGRMKGEARATGEAGTSCPSSFRPHPSAAGGRPSTVQASTILFCWELGGGLGHMMQMLPLARMLAARGHNVLVALRQLERAAAVFGRAGVRFLPASCWNAPGSPTRVRRLSTFTHLLINIGFGDTGELFARAAAWRNLFRLVKPDVVVFDHSPTALLGARGLPMRKALIGSGFCCPPACEEDVPWGLLDADLPRDQWPRLLEDERNVLARTNYVLDRLKQAPMVRLGELYSRVDENFLTTFPELEQYASRRTGPGARYWGPVLGEGGGEPRWPEGGKRVFAYLKRFEGLVGLLGALQDAGCATVAYVDGVGEAEARGMESEHLRVERRWLDLRKAAAECDLAVLHAGQGATAAVLLAGKPVLQIPLVLEQRLTARATRRLGVSETGPREGAGRTEMVRKLDALLSGDDHAAAARRFAGRYAAFDPAERDARMVERVEGLARRKRRAAVFAG